MTGPDEPHAPAAMPGRNLPPVVLIAGPTASGKSELAVRLAERLGGDVVNADSMQVYAELCVLTARPDDAALARAPHHGYGMRPGGAPMSAALWADWARRTVIEVRDRGRVPVLVGGTGLYFHALEHGLADVPAVPADVRAAAGARHAELGPAGFHAELARFDPVSAARLAPGDTQRVLRAWEVWHGTGRPLSAWQAEGHGGGLPGPVVRAVVMPERAVSRARIADRFAAMVKGGALEEVAALLARDLDPGLPVMKALGVRPLADHLAGNLDLEEAVRRAVFETGRYAKRQATWARGRMAHWKWLDAQQMESMEADILSIIVESWVDRETKGR